MIVWFPASSHFDELNQFDDLRCDLVQLELVISVSYGELSGGCCVKVSNFF